MEQLERLGIRAREAETSLRLLTTEKKIRCCIRQPTIFRKMRGKFSRKMRRTWKTAGKTE